MSIDSLRSSIESILRALPGSEPFESPVTGAKDIRLKRYIVHGIPVGHEHTPKTLQNLWLRRDDVRMSRVSDIPHTIKSAEALASKSGANSNLFAVDEFRGRDLVRFGVRSQADVIRVLSEACL